MCIVHKQHHFSSLISSNPNRHKWFKTRPAADQNKGRDGLMTVSPFSQSGAAILCQLANGKGRRSECRLCPLRNFPTPRWLSHRETDRYSSEKPTHSPSISVLFVLFLLCISFLPLAPTSTHIFPFFLRRDWNVTSTVHGCAQGLIPYAAEALAGR